MWATASSCSTCSGTGYPESMMREARRVLAAHIKLWYMRLTHPKVSWVCINLQLRRACAGLLLSRPSTGHVGP